jgi:hypothetical protein
VIKKIGWNNEGTAMIKTYIRLGSDDVLKEFMIKSGVKQNEERQRNNLPMQCSYCFAMNSAPFQNIAINAGSRSLMR